jgi:hypothetical protein
MLETIIEIQFTTTRNSKITGINKKSGANDEISPLQPPKKIIRKYFKKSTHLFYFS